jgi:site-specific DNA-methyltransferase (adenine-specific)
MDIKLLHGDCLELMKELPDKSIDMILCDLPYGTTKRRKEMIAVKVLKQIDEAGKDGGK